MDRDSTTRTGAKDPWGREGRPPAQRHVEASIVLDIEPGLLLWRKRAKGRSKLRGSDRMPGAGLRLRACRKALSDMLALKPYWGKPAVRNFRGGNGNVGIIRSPVRAIALLDLICSSISFRCPSAFTLSLLCSSTSRPPACESSVWLVTRTSSDRFASSR
jgi:hypothetical protein